MIEPSTPNSTVPVVFTQTGVMTVPWFRAVLTWIAAIVENTPAGITVMYEGATAPQGWEIDTTVGLPSLPAGKIWIKKV